MKKIKFFAIAASLLALGFMSCDSGVGEDDAEKGYNVEIPSTWYVADEDFTEGTVTAVWKEPGENKYVDVDGNNLDAGTKIAATEGSGASLVVVKCGNKNNKLQFDASGTYDLSKAKGVFTLTLESQANIEIKVRGASTTKIGFVELVDSEGNSVYNRGIPSTSVYATLDIIGAKAGDYTLYVDGVAVKYIDLSKATADIEEQKGAESIEFFGLVTDTVSQKDEKTAGESWAAGDKSKTFSTSGGEKAKAGTKVGLEFSEDAAYKTKNNPNGYYATISVYQGITPPVKDNTGAEVTSACEWEIADPSVAFISSSTEYTGKIVGKKAGKTKVRALIGSAIAEFVLVVEGDGEFTLNKLGEQKIEAYTGSVTAKATATTKTKIVAYSCSSDSNNTAAKIGDAASEVETVLTKLVTWTSSNEAVAKVSSEGKVTGLTAGTATITASIDGAKSQSFTVKVTKCEKTLVTLLDTAHKDADGNADFPSGKLGVSTSALKKVFDKYTTVSVPDSTVEDKTGITAANVSVSPLTFDTASSSWVLDSVTANSGIVYANDVGTVKVSASDAFFSFEITFTNSDTKNVLNLTLTDIDLSGVADSQQNQDWGIKNGETELKKVTKQKNAGAISLETPLSIELAAATEKTENKTTTVTPTTKTITVSAAWNAAVDKALSDTVTLKNIKLYFSQPTE